jgi:NTE family protein
MIFRMKKFLTTILLPLLLASTIVAQDIDRPKIGLVLSGGGAHGLAHIGVLRYLEDKDIPIDYITGTSMGAVIGGLYAMGYDSHKIEGIARAVDWDDVLS